MNKFKQRIDKVWAGLKEAQETEEFSKLTHYQKVTFNCKFLKSRREGQYLIKVSENNYTSYCGEDQQYIDFTYNCSGYFGLGVRDNAQWFTKDEIKEFKWKGFKVVRRSSK